LRSGNKIQVISKGVPSVKTIILVSVVKIALCMLRFGIKKSIEHDPYYASFSATSQNEAAA
jgi:hypothetical protein